MGLLIQGMEGLWRKELEARGRLAQNWLNLKGEALMEQNQDGLERNCRKNHVDRGGPQGLGVFQAL